jgi:hypothetical protein
LKIYIYVLTVGTTKHGEKQRKRHIVRNAAVITEVGKVRMINADIYVTARLYDDEHEENRDERMTIADFLDRFTDEGCPTKDKRSEDKRGRR